MAISFVGSHVGTHAAVSGQVINFSNLRNEANQQPTLLQGDLVLVAIENASTVDRTQAQLTPSGYTPAHADDYRNDSNDSNFLVSSKVMGASPDSSVTIPASNATTAGVGYAIYVLRGVNTVAGPFDATPVVTGAINTGIANANAITPITAGAWIVVFAGAAVAAGAVFTNPAGMSAATNHFRTATITTTTNDANIAGAIYTGWTSGSYDPAAFGGSTSTNTGSWSAVTLALKPIVTHATGGVLSGGAAVLDGTAARMPPSVTHTASGTLAGQGAAIDAAAARVRAHAATGALAGPGAALVTTAARTRLHAAAAVLVGGFGSLAGSAARTSPGVTHAASGALVGPGPALSAAASRWRAFVASGSLLGPGAALQGAAAGSGVSGSCANPSTIAINVGVGL